MTFSGNGNVNIDIFTSIIWCQLHRLSSSTVQHSPVGLPVAKLADNIWSFPCRICPILDKMMFYSSLHLYCIKLSATCFKIFHCREWMAWIEDWLQKLKIFYSLSSITLIKYGGCTCINSILQFPSQIRVTLKLQSILATQNSAITQFRLKNRFAGFWPLLIFACSRCLKIYCYFIYLFFKTFKICIFKAKIVFPYFEGIFVQNTGNSYYLAGVRKQGPTDSTLKDP